MFKNLLLTSVLFLLLSCVTTGPGGKQSLIIIPENQEIAIGKGMAMQVEETEKILDDPVWQNYLNTIGQKIVAVSDRSDLKFYFKVIESDQINAFAAPGGYVYFYTGLLKEMDNEAELAAVMAHEISHVVSRHGIKRMQASLGTQIAYELVFGGEEASDALNAAIGVGLELTFAGYSRSNEREADAFGMHYMILAGYNPEGAVSMFQKLAELGGAGLSKYEQLVSSHPDTQERISKAKAKVAELRPLPKSLSFGRTVYSKMKSRLQ